MTQALFWNQNKQALPFDKPVLARKRDEPVPFMVVRNSDYAPDSVSYLLGPTASPYGIYVDLDDLECWAAVL